MANILSQKAVLAGLNISKWTARRLDRSVTEDVRVRHNAAPDSGRYNKRLVARDALEKITTLISSARAEHYRMTQPWIDQGARLLPSALYIDYSNRFRDLKNDFDVAADDFARDYPQHVKDAKKRLNGMFDPSDYPDPADIRSRFNLGVNVTPCPDAEDFRISIAQEHYDDMKAELEQRLTQAVDDSMSDTVNRILETVGHMAERLRAYEPGGKSKKPEGQFRDSLVENVRDLARLLPAFNMTGNNRIADIANRIETQLCAKDAKRLRESEADRNEVATAAETILADVKDFMS